MHHRLVHRTVVIGTETRGLNLYEPQERESDVYTNIQHDVEGQQSAFQKDVYR